MKETFEIFTLDLHPHYNVTAALFRDVTNSSALRSKLMKGELNCALINVTYIPGMLAVLLACNKSVHCYTNSSMKTRSLHTEVIYNLSPTNSIKDSLKNFSISDDEKIILYVAIRKVSEDTDPVCNIVDSIEGNIGSLDDLSVVSNAEKIKELYKIGDKELNISSLTEAVVMRVSTKDAL